MSVLIGTVRNVRPSITGQILFTLDIRGSQGHGAIRSQTIALTAKNAALLSTDMRASVTAQLAARSIATDGPIEEPTP